MAEPDDTISQPLPADEKPILFDDLVRRQELRDAALDAPAPVQPLPPARTPPPPVLDPNNVVFGTEMEPQAMEVPFDVLNTNSVFDPMTQIPTGRMFPGSSSELPELIYENTVIADPIDARFVTVNSDVWEEIPAPGGGTPNHILRFARGSRVPTAVVQHMKRMPVVPPPPSAVEIPVVVEEVVAVEIPVVVEEVVVTPAVSLQRSAKPKAKGKKHA